MEAHMGLKEVGMPTKVALVALAFIFAPAFVGEDTEQQPVCGLTLPEAEKIAAAHRQRQKAEARACARSAQSGAAQPEGEGAAALPPAQALAAGGKHKQE
jgi:hypothetical protein